MSHKFKVGDVVQLISGGPEMTVHGYEQLADLTEISYSETHVECVWFLNKEKRMEVFHQDALKKIENDTSGRPIYT